MDTLVEKEFLEVLEDEKEIILSKQNNKHVKYSRALAWNNVKLMLENRTRKFDMKRQKKWNNIQTRLSVLLYMKHVRIYIQYNVF